MSRWRTTCLIMIAFVLSDLPMCLADQVRAMDLLPYLTDSPPSIQIEIKLCNVFKVVEKPYYILFGSCWLCAVVQQLIDHTRMLEERNEELGLTQKSYVGLQLLALVMETFDMLNKVDWLDCPSPWNMYNLYVYIFVHSSVFVRSVMMSMIVWDWFNAQLLKRPIFGMDWDGKGCSDRERACLLVVILQFGSSAFIMAIVAVTHVVPSLIVYYWVFLLASGFIIKIRSWLRFLGITLISE